MVRGYKKKGVLYTQMFCSYNLISQLYEEYRSHYVVSPSSGPPQVPVALFLSGSSFYCSTSSVLLRTTRGLVRRGQRYGFDHHHLPLLLQQPRRLEQVSREEKATNVDAL